MLKRVLIAALMSSAFISGYSSTKPRFETEKDAIEAAKSQILEKVNKDLSDLKVVLSSAESKAPNPGFNKEMKSSDQFLCQKSKVADLYKNGEAPKKASQLSEIYERLKKGHRPTYFSFEGVKAEQQGKPEEQKNENLLYNLNVSFEAHTITPDINNDAKYKVTFHYTVTLKPIKEHPTIDGKMDKTKPKEIIAYEIDKWKFLNSDVKDIDILATETESMKQEAAKTIADWYKHIPGNLEPKYSEYISRSTAINPVNGNGITLKQNGKSFTAAGKPIEIEFIPNIPEDSLYLYTNPKATISIIPSFTIVFGNDLKTIVSENIVSDYKTQVKPAETDSAKVSHYIAAYNTVVEFGNALSEYVSNRNKENRENLVTMFADSKKDEVGVSHRSKFNNQEKINKRKAEQYLQLLKGNGLTFEKIEYVDSAKTATLNAENPELNLKYDSNLNTVIFEITQLYDGQNYKDSTRKLVIATKQDNGSYLIEKIIVVPNSTTTL